MRAPLTILSMVLPWAFVAWLSTVNFWASLITGIIVGVVELYVLDAILRVEEEVFGDGID